MMLLTVEEIIELHDKLIRRTGGLPGLRERDLLESAVFSASAAFDDVEQYPLVEEKAARLAYAITNNHAFLDGNKRIGLLAMLLTLDLNGINLHYSQAELIQLGLGIADSSLDYDLVLKWVQDHKMLET